MATGTRCRIRLPYRHLCGRRESIPRRHGTHGAGHLIGQESRQHPLPAPLPEGRPPCRLRELHHPAELCRRRRILRLPQRAAHRVPRQPAHGRQHMGVSGHLRLRRGMQHSQLCGAHQLQPQRRLCDRRRREDRRRHGQCDTRRLQQRTAAHPRGHPLLRPMGRSTRFRVQSLQREGRLPRRPQLTLLLRHMARRGQRLRTQRTGQARAAGAAALHTQRRRMGQDRRQRTGGFSLHLHHRPQRRPAEQRSDERRVALLCHGPARRCLPRPADQIPQMDQTHPLRPQLQRDPTAFRAVGHTRDPVAPELR